MVQGYRGDSAALITRRLSDSPHMGTGIFSWHWQAMRSSVLTRKINFIYSVPIGLSLFPTLITAKSRSSTSQFSERILTSCRWSKICAGALYAASNLLPFDISS